MDSSINEIFERMNLKQFVVFLLTGVGDSVEDIDRRTYQVKLSEDSKNLFNRLENLYSDHDELEKALSDVYDTTVAHDEVYTEIGMKAGARLIYQLLIENDSAVIRKEKTIEIEKDYSDNDIFEYYSHLPPERQKAVREYAVSLFKECVNNHEITQI